MSRSKLVYLTSFKRLKALTSFYRVSRRIADLQPTGTIGRSSRRAPRAPSRARCVTQMRGCTGACERPRDSCSPPLWFSATARNTSMAPSSHRRNHHRLARSARAPGYPSTMPPKPSGAPPSSERCAATPLRRRPCPPSRGERFASPHPQGKSTSLLKSGPVRFAS